MEAKASTASIETVPVAKSDLIEAWKVLDKVVVSLRKMGSYYSTPARDVPLPSEQHQEMLESLDKFMSAELWRELAHARRLLSEYLPDDETEEMSEHVIEYWKPTSAPTGK